STPDKLARAGKDIYKQHCLVCHGEKGMGDGPASTVLTTRPRNFTAGYFKFKTSTPEETPFVEDRYRTISAGIPAAGMPSFGDLTPFERWALVATVKSLAVADLGDDSFNHFERRPAKTKMPLAQPPEKFDPQRGATLFTSIGCWKCHGEKGFGDGPSAEDLTDSLDQPIKVPDMTRGEVTFKAGFRAEDVYRTLTTGMAGTPMPSFTTISDEERWQLAHYVTTLYRPIDPGERVFLRVGCTSCHTVGRGKLIGPDLAGVVQRRSPEWLKAWLKDPPTMLATDETARQLLAEYLTPMPSYGLTDREIALLIDYMKTLPPAQPEQSGSND
ncbi:MAG: cytochrome c, partial [Planctomycetes bacterium]|nr:cytochrome c [Planctomycetota bacterium]